MRICACLFITYVISQSPLWGKPVSPELSTRWILEQIKTHKIKSIEGLLEKFSASSLERHLLAYGSGSQQFADWLSPRVIVYSYDADFIMAFNGEPGSKGYHELEIIKFDHDTSAFHPEVIYFDPKGVADPVPNFAPTECRTCHQSSFRPNWDPYFHWVGFYGSEDDNANAGEYGERELTTGPENENYAKYLAKKAEQAKQKSGRYRFLPEHPEKRRNGDFNDRVTCLNMKKMLKSFSAHALSGQIWPHVKKARVDVENLPETVTKLASRSFEVVRNETEAVLIKARERRIARHIVLTGDQPHGRVLDLLEKEIHPVNIIYDVDTVSSWRYVFEEIFKQPFRPFSLSRHKDYHLNLGAEGSILALWKDSRVDNSSGRVILSKEPQFRDEDPYDYTCPRSPSYLDLPIKRRGAHLPRVVPFGGFDAYRLKDVAE